MIQDLLNIDMKAFAQKHLLNPISIAPLVMLRVLFGFIMLVSIIRFMVKGWVYDQYIMPTYHFTFYGFDWIQPMGPEGMYAVFAVMAVCAVLIMVGGFYRLAVTTFFVLFTYVELIDKTNYLNHYYFVSIISFLLILVPANRYFSLDVLRNPALRVSEVPAWTLNIFKLQLGIVYFFAGVAKLNPDWLFEAMPLKMWLPALSHLRIIGPLLAIPETAYVFSWAGAIYDLTVFFFLLNARTRPFAYIAVVGFHVMTGLLFQIGMFPWIMILCTLIFFSPAFHKRVLNKLGDVGQSLFKRSTVAIEKDKSWTSGKIAGRLMGAFLIVHFALQLVLPFRSALYPGELFWTEQGYRFSWRVMLMEKAGYAAFNVHDADSGKSWEVANWEYLTPVQEKMMATQPDMLLQFAHHLKEEYEEQGIHNVQITADAFVTLNGERSRRFIDPAVDLTQIKRGYATKNWILPFEEK